MKHKKILVTGAAGFIGFHLVRRVIDEGYEVLGLDNINGYYDLRLKYARLAESGIEEGRVLEGAPVRSSKYPSYRFVKLDLQDRESLDCLFRDEEFDTVCHLAAQAGVRYSVKNPHAYAESNLVGFINLIETCRNYRKKHFIFASSSSVYGLNRSVPFSTHSDSDHPVSLYGATKKSNELIAHSYSYLYGLPCTGLRLFTVYGPWGRPDMACFLFTKAILGNKSINVYNRGNMNRDFTYVDDTVEGIFRVIDRPIPRGAAQKNMPSHSSSAKAPFSIYNIGNGSPVTLKAFIKSIENALGRKARKRMSPMQAGDVRSTWANMEDFNRDYGFLLTTPLHIGILRFISWYQDYYRG